MNEPGAVLFCDAETDLASFSEIVQNVSQFLGLSGIPEKFHVWSPNWEARVKLNDAHRSDAEKMLERAAAVEPALVIVDPLRMFWPRGEKGSEDAVGAIKELRQASRDGGCSWLIVHHRRKLNQQLGAVHLEDEPQLWFQEAAGSLAFVNQTDTRIGVVPHTGRADLLVAGFVRGSGAFVLLDLKRVLDADGAPVGYSVLTGIDI